MLRKFVKARDAYDIYQLRIKGSALDGNLKGHLNDTLSGHEIEAEDIEKRIALVDDKRCRNELKTLLPSDVFDGLMKEGFQDLRDALRELYRDWIENGKTGLSDYGLDNRH
jgi:hypothetical protein